MIEEVSADGLIRSTRSILGLPGGSSEIDEPYIAASLRRLAGFLCPCSPSTLIRAMLESHLGFANKEELRVRVETTVETLVAIGDLLEIGDVTFEGDAFKGTWLAAAPPAFVARDSGSVFLLGLSADEQTPLPSEMRSRVAVVRAIRSIDPEPNEDLPEILRELGMRQLSLSGWLKEPKPLSPKEVVGAYNSKLDSRQRSGEVPDLLVLDGGLDTRSYRRRWTAPGSLSGNFVVRRPQAYGADLWGYAQLFNGEPVKLLDLPVLGERWRGCDVAWRLQLAIDHLAGKPQQYRLASDNGGFRIDLFSPIPLWGRRRLAVIGQEVAPGGCLLSFAIPSGEVASETRFLEEQLFLSRDVL
jgi:hypothetical protein